jgi:hypothetical protein
MKEGRKEERKEESKKGKRKEGKGKQKERRKGNQGIIQRPCNVLDICLVLLFFSLVSQKRVACCFDFYH